jgi:hypothetical protein
MPGNFISSFCNLAPTHPCLEIGYWASQVGVIFVAIGAAIVAGAHVNLFQRFEILKYLQSAEIRAARGYLFEHSLKEKPYEAWTIDDKSMAATVCASYDVVGLLLGNRWFFAKLRGRFFIREWAPSIVRTFEIIRPLILERRLANGTGYWKHYEWLYNAASRYPIRLPGK